MQTRFAQNGHTFPKSKSGSLASVVLYTLTSVVIMVVAVLLLPQLFKNRTLLSDIVIDWILQIASGIFWTCVYILVIKRGFQDKTFGMPLVALCANLAWEFIFCLSTRTQRPNTTFKLLGTLLASTLFFLHSPSSLFEKSK